jgi:hypothetical protein
MVSADPRDTARRWLAEVIDSVADLGLARHVIADAILAGVEVTTILRPIDGSRRIALLLPAEDGGGS